MKLTFLGAAHEVTGSCYLLQTNGHNLLIDCGMEQGPDLFENQALPVNPWEVEAILVTHAHIDHSGKLPLLYKEGFQGRIYATEATCDLCGIMLRDSAHIQEFEASWRNRKARRSGKPEYIPIYTMQDAEGVLEHFTPCEYHSETEILPGIMAEFIDAGHLLGSASIRIKAQEEGKTVSIVFSGDIGNTDKPILRDPEHFTEADYVITESTYGDRVHGPKPDYVRELAAIIQRTLDRGGNLVIPAFAVGRTQEILYFIRQVKEQGLVRNHDNFPVYVDSPLANEATNIFGRNSLTCFDEETMAVIRRGINPIGFPGLTVSLTGEDSRAINDDPVPKVILSASGMCEAGRIRHHLKHNLWRPESTVLFVGYQSAGTLGRSLLEGAKTVKLFGETIEVHAEIAQLKSISGHGDSNGLVKWMSAYEKKPQRVFVTHGEDKVCDLLAERDISELGLNACAPYNGEQWDLIQNCMLKEGNKERLQAVRANGSEDDFFKKLAAAVKRLIALAERKRKAPRKELEELTRDINNICRKWE